MVCHFHYANTSYKTLRKNMLTFHNNMLPGNFKPVAVDHFPWTHFQRFSSHQHESTIFLLDKGLPSTRVNNFADPFSDESKKVAPTCISLNLKSFTVKLARNYMWIYFNLFHPSENIKVRSGVCLLPCARVCIWNVIHKLPRRAVNFWSSWEFSLGAIQTSGAIFSYLWPAWGHFDIWSLAAFSFAVANILLDAARTCSKVISFNFRSQI
jgi:hypothetical protein